MKYNRLLALALALCLVLILAGCGLEPFREEVKGSGVLKQNEMPLPDIPGGYVLRMGGINMQGAIRELKLVIDESLKNAAVLETDNNILLRLDLKRSPALDEITLSAPRNMVFSPTKLILTVGVPVRELIVDGLWEVRYDCPSVRNFKLAVDGSASGDFALGTLDRLDMNISGLSDINMNCQGVRECKLVVDGSLGGKFAFGEMDSLDMRLSGLSTIGMSGTARRVVLKLDGGVDISAFDLIAQDAEVTISGLGSCEITAEQSLYAKIDGAGSITYGGSPAVTQRIDGLGSIRARR